MPNGYMWPNLFIALEAGTAWAWEIVHFLDKACWATGDAVVLFTL